MKHLQFVATTLIFGLGIFIGIECLHKGQSALGFFLILGQVAPKLKLLEAAISQKAGHDSLHVLLEDHGGH